MISNNDNKLYKSKNSSLLVIAIIVTLLIFTSASNYGSSAFSSSVDNSAMMRMRDQSESFHPISQHVMLTPTQIYNRAGNSVVFITAPTNNGVFTGSGFFFDAVGHIVTNRHVVFDATNVIVTLSNGNKYATKIIGSDFYSDLAVLSIDNTAAVKDKIIPIELGTSGNLSVGEQVFAIGSPLGIEGTMTQGILSRLHYRIPLYSYHGSFNPSNPRHEVIVFDSFCSTKANFPSRTLL